MNELSQATIALKWKEGVTNCFMMLIIPHQKYSITGKTQQDSTLEERARSLLAQPRKVHSKGFATLKSWWKHSGCVGGSRHLVDQKQ